jgi:hypothetical protein
MLNRLRHFDWPALLAAMLTFLAVRAFAQGLW